MTDSTSTASTPRQSVADLAAERNRLRRRVHALVAGNGWLERASELFGDMSMQGPHGIMDAIGKARRRFLPQHLHDVPLCDIERCLFRQGMAAFVVVLVYELVKPAVVRQLEAMVVEMRDSPEAAERYGKGPVFDQAVPSTWPGNGARYGQVR